MSWKLSGSPCAGCTPSPRFNSGLEAVEEFSLISKLVNRLQKLSLPLNRDDFMRLLARSFERDLPGFVKYVDGRDPVKVAANIFSCWKSFLQAVRAMELKSKMKKCRFGLLKHQIPQVKRFQYEEFLELVQIAKECQL